MTVAPRVEPLAFEDFSEAVRALRERGLRLSTSRRLVLGGLFAAEGPVSAEHLTRSLQIELTSVYRNLETLERNGFVRHVHLGHGPGLYVLVGRGEREYLYCERCGAVRALEPRQLDPVRSRVRQLSGYHARFTHFALVGTCGECAKRRPGAGGASRIARSGEAMTDEHDHRHEHPHSHEHEHEDGTVHEHVHTEHEHEHVEHEHEHSHGDHVHSHSHVHEQGLEDEHEHGH
jgi:Fur family ferric uptake transcriptional regulator